MPLACIMRVLSMLYHMCFANAVSVYHMCFANAASVYHVCFVDKLVPSKVAQRLPLGWPLLVVM